MYHTKLFQISLTLKGDTKSVWKLIRELRVIYYKRILKFTWYLITAISYIVRSVPNFTNIIVFHYDVSVTRCYKMFRITLSYNTLIKKKKGYLCSNTFASCYIPVVVSRSAFESSSWKRNCSGFSMGNSHENSVKRFPSWSPNWYGYLTNNAICHASISITER